MRATNVKDIECYIDATIDDAILRAIDWQITVYILMDEPAKAIAAKWQRANYLLGVYQ